MRRALSLLFIFLIVSMAMMPLSTTAQGSEGKITYHIKVYDSQGRELTSDNYFIRKYAKLKIYTHSWLTFNRKLIRTIPGEDFNLIGEAFSVDRDTSKVEVEFYWISNRAYTDVISLDSAQFDDLGNKIIYLNLPFTPAVPITSLQSESIIVSSDLHEISTSYYNVKFGTGNSQSQIEVTIGQNTYIMPVKLQFTGQGSETKPFRFLAQSTSGYVKGEDKFLIWTTAYYWSAVRTSKVGDNMLLVVWTYGYTNVAGAWMTKVIASIMAGAVMGAVTGIGAVPAACAGGIISGILWAVKPDLINLEANTGIGVVAALFTPRYFMIQGVGGLGANGTSATIEIQNIPSSAKGATGNIRYEIYSGSNTLQVGFTKNCNSMISKFYDYEDGVLPSDMEAKDYTFETTSYNVYAGGYSLKIASTGYINWTIAKNVPKGKQYGITFSTYIRDSDDGGFLKMYIYGIKEDGGIDEVDNYVGGHTITGWEFFEWTWHITTQNDYTKIILQLKDGGSYFAPIVDNTRLIIEDNSKYRYIFDTNGHSSNIVRYMFGTIPTIAPSNTGIAIDNRYTLLAVDMAGRDGMLAVDWNSRMVTISPARIIVKTDVWTETAWLLATDDKDGFKNVTFVVTSPNKFIYRVDFMSYYYFTTPKNWTVKPGWNPFIANNTTIYVPNLEGINFELEKIKWNLEAWWEKIGTWGHLALMGLAVFIIFIIILILAPWVILLIVRILSLIIRGLVKAFGMAAKGAGNLMKSFKRRRRR